MDTILAIAVASVLLAGSLLLYRRTVDGIQRQRLTAQIQALAGGVRDAFQNGDAVGYGPAADITRRMFELRIGTDDSRGTDAFRTPYGDPYQIASEGSRFRISVRLPAAACAATHLYLPGLVAVALQSAAGEVTVRPPWIGDTLAAIAAACRMPPVLVSYLFR